MTPEEARAYFKRWELVRELEAAELRGASMEAKLRQLGSLMASRQLFAPDSGRERETEVVRQRWAQLRKALGG